MRSFDYLEPCTLSEALELLGEPRRVLPVAGGTNAVVGLREGCIEADRVMWLGRLAELKRIDADKDGLRIGSLITIRTLLGDALVREHAPLLVEAGRELGAPAIRNLATLGGNLVQASPAGDMAPPLLALGAHVRLLSARGERTVELGEFFRGPGETVTRADELLTEVILPLPAPRSGSCFIKLGRRKALAIAIASVAALVTLDESRAACREVRIAMGSVAPTPLRIRSAEDALRGLAPSPENLERAAATCAVDIAPVTDERARAGYRRSVAPPLIRRAIEAAVTHARSG